MKKSVGLFLTLIMIFSVLTSVPLTVSAASNGSCGLSVVWNLDDDGVLTIRGTGAIKDYSSTSSSPFKDNSDIKRVVIETGITRIGDNTFSGCINLISVSVPDTVDSIGSSAFYACENIIAVYIDSIENWCNIEMEGFYSNPIYYSKSLYLDNKLVTELVIPNGVKNIKAYTFYECSSLISVTIPDSVTTIGKNAFYNCDKLTSIVIPNSVVSIGKQAFAFCSKMKTAVIGDGVTSVTNDTFYYCLKLNTVLMSKNIESISNNAFYGCSQLKNVYFKGSEEDWLNILIGASGNEYIINAVKTYNYEYDKIYDTIFTTDEVLSLNYIATRKFDFVVTDTEIAKVSSVSSVVTSIGSSYRQESTAKIIPLKPGAVSIQVVSATGEVLARTHVLIVEGEHQFILSSILKSATCTEKGEELYICKFCQFEEKRIVNEYGHIESEWVVDVKATCIETGARHKECITCGAILETEQINATGHKASELIVDVDATCVEKGKGHKECVTCGLQLEVNEIDAKGHYSDVWIIDSPATVYKSGVKHQECDGCGQLLGTEKIAQLKCSKPKISKVSNITKGVKITWNKVKGADKYRVYRKTKGGEWKYLGSTSKTNYTDETTKSGTKYYYAIKARNEAGNSSLSSSCTIKRLSVPKLSKITNHTDGVKVNWGKVKGASGYIVYRKTKDGSWKQIDQTTKNYYIDGSAKSGKTYYYTVRAISDSTKSYYNTKGLKIAYLDAPMLHSIGWSSSDSVVDFTWCKVKGATGYYVYRATGKGKYKKIATVKGNSNVCYIDKSHKTAPEYKYKVKAYNKTATSAYSDYYTIDY